MDQRTDPALGGAGISLIDEIALGKYVAELADCLEPRWAAPVGAQTPATRLATELDRHKGQLLLLQGHSEAAEELYRKALGIAEEQGAKLWELRAATSLARLWRGQGRRIEARDLLAPVYSWFTEGFCAPDLKDAKALLNELNA